jgi:hypothetical protein
MLFFEAAPGRTSAIEKKFFFVGLALFTSKWNYCRVTGPQNKIFIKNQLTLLYSVQCARHIVNQRKSAQQMLQYASLSVLMLHYF